MFDPASVRFRGPLTPHVDGFWQELVRLGYAPLSAGHLLQFAAHFSRWLADRSLDCGDITDERVDAFMGKRRSQGYTHFRWSRSLTPLLRYLRGLGVVPASRSTVATSRVDQFVASYAGYLARERGLAASTIRGYSDFARRFVMERPIGSRLRWERLRPADITSFVLREARRWSVGQVKNEVTALRSLLRYLHVEGRVRSDLASCVPAVAGWRLAGLPKGLEPDQVRRMLQACDPRSTLRVGRRDAAIVRLLVRLGLRAGDVAALTLDDLDWRAGEIVLRGKGRREGRLPLPQDVGQVLAAYLRDRRAPTSSRRVFLCSRAPYTPLTTSGLIGAVRCVLRRVGIIGGAHLLRHTAATQMLRHGASLAEIGHVLRHRQLDTTAIYAKVDFAALRTLAQPWPGGAA
ncbi:MAG TPA: site-specific integrase [Anaeromyxobacteraceae bacterium]|nr:site-specific integrase [Anaeromyxobacteraceae bacterium]